MTGLPDPMTPQEVDLRGSVWMPWYGNLVVGSDFDAIATDTEYRAAQRLWWASWQQQVPAGSLPDDERILAHLAGFGRDLKSWAKVREMALHGFVKCADGRLYHPFISAQAVIAYDNRQRAGGKREADRLRLSKWREVKKEKRDAAKDDDDGNKVETRFDTRNDTPGETLEVAAKSRLIPNHTIPDSTNISSLRSDIPPNPNPAPKVSKPAGRRGACDDSEFDQFWNAYPRKVGKGSARRAWAAAVRKANPEAIIAAVRAQKFDAREKYQPHPATWLNDERWLDCQQTGDPVLRAAGLSDNGEILEDFKPDQRWEMIQ